MRKEYTTPSMEITTWESDVITTSGIAYNAPITTASQVTENSVTISVDYNDLVK